MHESVMQHRQHLLSRLFLRVPFGNKLWRQSCRIRYLIRTPNKVVSFLVFGNEVWDLELHGKTTINCHAKIEQLEQSVRYLCDLANKTDRSNQDWLIEKPRREAGVVKWGYYNYIVNLINLLFSFFRQHLATTCCCWSEVKVGVEERVRKLLIT